MKKEMVCVACPIGCRLTAVWNEGSTDVDIAGNECRRGEEYGTEEVRAPRRIVTATVAITGSTMRRVPVKSDRPVPKELIGELLRSLYQIEMTPPARSGQVIIENFESTGVNVIITRTVPPESGHEDPIVRIP